MDKNANPAAATGHELDYLYELDLPPISNESPMIKDASAQNQAQNQAREVDLPRKYLTCCLIAVSIVAVLALVLALVAVLLAVSTFTNNPSQKPEIDYLRELLNQTRESQLAQNAILTGEVQWIRDTLENQQNLLRIIQPGTIAYPLRSCQDLSQDSPSGEYWIQTNSSSSPVQVYCDTNPRNCSCNTTGGWMRVANLDMTDPSQQCPDGFRLVNRTAAPLRTCGRPEPPFRGCMSTTYPTCGVEYLQICGRVIGYQFGLPEAFDPYLVNATLTIDNVYADGVSLTHGQLPRQHIWTFAGARDEVNPNMMFSCPCIEPAQPFTFSLPPYVGQDYFCDTGSRGNASRTFYPDDPLWNGQGCGGTSTCCSLNNPPWFCKQLLQPTTDDIELRLCGSALITGEDFPLERVEIYVQ